MRAKKIVITDDWRDLWQAAHNRAFTVAKMAKRDLLANTQAIITRKLAEGRTLQQAAAELEAEFRKAGWWGKRAADGAQLGSARRIRTILRTNAATAYAAGRYRQQKATAEARPWWRYVAIRDGVTRLAHRQLHGKILKHDDPAWQAIYPPNGFNCRCQVQSLSERQAEAAFAADPDARMTGAAPETRKVDMVNKRTGEVFTRPVTDVKLTDAGGERWFAPDAGWAHVPGAGLLKGPGRRYSLPDKLRPGEANWESLRLPAELRAPQRRPTPPAALPAEGIDTLAKWLVTARAVVGVKAGGSRRITTPGDIEDVVVTDATLRHVIGSDDKYRARYINRLEPTVADPDEVWLVEYVSGDKVEFRRHFLKAWDDKKATFLVAAEDSAGNLSITFMPMSRVREINKRRRGVLLYRRLEEGEE